METGSRLRAGRSRQAIPLVLSWVVRMDQTDLSLLLTEITKLANDLASSGLRESDLKDLKLPEGFELKLCLQKRDKVMEKAKVFLNSCDGFLQPLASMNPIAASLYGGLKCIITVSPSTAPHVDAYPNHIHR